jgi:hypothetical protein
MAKRSASAEEAHGLQQRAREWDDAIKKHGKCPTCIKNPK